MQVQAYLNFDGRCEEALEFYRKALGAEVSALMKFKDSPEPCGEGGMPPGTENKVMHSMFRVGETMLMASDCHCKGQPKFEGISLALSPKSVASAEKLFAALSDGGAVQMPLTKTFWSPSFGVVTDKFGVPWMISAMA